MNDMTPENFRAAQETPFQFRRLEITPDDRFSTITAIFEREADHLGNPEKSTLTMIAVRDHHAGGNRLGEGISEFFITDQRELHRIYPRAELEKAADALKTVDPEIVKRDHYMTAYGLNPDCLLDPVPAEPEKRTLSLV